MGRQSHGRRVPLRATVSVATVMFIAGVMFTTNARLAGGEEDRHPENLGELVEQESERGDALFAEVESLRAEVEELTEQATPEAPRVPQDAALRTGILTGRTAVRGPAVQVSVQDAPTDGLQAQQWKPDDLVVHQQDLEGIINALWAGGAEAMMLEGQRVSSLSAFRCVGNVLSLHGRVYSPPYDVVAIGDQQDMVDALYASRSVGAYLDFVEQAGLGWEVTELDDVSMPAYTGSSSLTYAQVPEGTDIYQ